MGMAAIAIDASQWYQRHHQAQVVADSAALAAANCLANPNVGNTIVNGASLPDCSSSTDTSDAQSVAVAYASANGLAIDDSDVVLDTTSGTVTVTANVSGATFFAKIVGLLTSSQTAQATATWRPSKKIPCGAAGSNCDFMFANSSNCGTGAGNAVSVTLQGSASINGNVVTNGSLNASLTGNSGGINGSGSYGPGGCSSSTGGNHSPWKTSNPSQATGTVTWPIDYTEDFPACGASPLAACAASGYPTWCTYTGTSFAFNGAPSNTDSIYCASGSGAGVNTGDPSTWNGAITFNMSGNNTFTDTFVAGSITYNGTGNDTVSACGFATSGFTSSTCSAPAPPTANYPVFYVVGSDPSGSSALSIDKSNGSLGLNGDIFVPNGTVTGSLGGSQSTYTFIEANAINVSASGNFLGDGPQLNGGDSGATISGGDSLTG